MGKKSPKHSPKKQPTSATTERKPEDSQPSKPASAQTTKPVGALARKPCDTKPQTEKVTKPLTLIGSSINKGQSEKIVEDGKTKEDILTKRSEKQKAAKEALLEQDEHDNIEVITAGIERVTVKRKKEAKDSTEPKDEEECEDVEEEEEYVWTYEDAIVDLIELLDCRDQYIDEHDKATTTLALFEGILNEEDKWKTTRELMDRMMNVNAEITAKVPHETTSRCVLYRLRKMIIKEFMTIIRDHMPEASTGRSAASYFREFALIGDVEQQETRDLPDVPAGMDPVAVGAKVKEGLIAAVEEYKSEMDNIPNVIAQLGPKLISEDEIVLTHSFCPITTELFITAAETCRFTLCVCESSPIGYGHLLVDELRERKVQNIDVIFLSDDNISNVMPGVNKVIMPCQAVLHTGDCKTQAFGSIVAMEAETYSIPVYCVAASYQVAPSMVHNVNRLLDNIEMGDDGSSTVPLIGHRFDTTDSKDISKIVSNWQIFPPFMAKQLVTELYTARVDKEDDEKEDSGPTFFATIAT